MLVAVTVVRSAHAREFEVEIIVDTVEDLYAYEERGELTQGDVETLSGLLLRPLDLNRADRNILFELPGVTNLVARSIVEYRAENGDFEQIDELLEVPGMQDVILLQMRPFITIGELGPEKPADWVTAAGLGGRARSGVQYREGFIPPFDDFERDIDERLERAHGPQAFLELETQAFTYFSAGALMTYRRGMDIQWDPNAFGGAVAGGGAFVSPDGPNNRVRFEHLYLTSTYGGVNVILGSFTAGFGERLTFNTSEYQLPSGWYSNLRFTEDNELGRVRPRTRQFGVAVSYDGFNLGSSAWLEATAFASSNILDLFQGDFAYGGAHEGCGDSDVGYVCNDLGTPDDVTSAGETADFLLDGRDRNSRVYDPGDSLTDVDDASTYSFESLRRAYREDVVGGNLTVHFDDALAWGVTSYVGQTDFRFPEESGANFGYSAGVPRNELQPYGAVGSHLRWIGMTYDVGIEYARSFVSGGGDGVTLRVNTSPIDALDVVTSLRYYGPNFVNPRGNPRAGADEVFGQRDRNELGGSIRAIVRPFGDLRLRTTVEYWQNRNDVFLTEDGYESREREVPLDDFRFAQRVDFGLTTREDLFFNFDYANRLLRSLDLDRFGYSTGGGDTCIPLERELTAGDNRGAVVSDCDVGVRMRFQAGLTSTRIPLTSLYARLEYIRQDDNGISAAGEPTKSGAIRAVLRARVRPWNGGAFIANATLRPEASFGLIAEDAQEEVLLVADSEPRQYYYLEYIQRIAGQWTLTGRYGFQDYRRIDPDNRFDVGRYRYYNVFRLKAEYRF